MMNYPRMDEIMTIETMTLKELETRESLCSSTVPLTPMILEMEKRIEDFDQYAFADFANCRLGGGSLHGAGAHRMALQGGGDGENPSPLCLLAGTQCPLVLEMWRKRKCSCGEQTPRVALVNICATVR